eukprot:gnl/Chilomastix_cuspidata/3578.p1 GENE.gnl/Chilomastix_cuspidata/3578~~gnl/Chilomastix_cuspidata/3578.p1  ORF type:complete len:510 (-),score=185.62 gnl/Chilomastix_cuspidata/3578:405-1934(-)
MSANERRASATPVTHDDKGPGGTNKGCSPDQTTSSIYNILPPGNGTFSYPPAANNTNAPLFGYTPGFFSPPTLSDMKSFSPMAQYTPGLLQTAPSADDGAIQHRLLALRERISALAAKTDRLPEFVSRIDALERSVQTFIRELEVSTEKLSLHSGTAELLPSVQRHTPVWSPRDRSRRTPAPAPAPTPTRTQRMSSVEEQIRLFQDWGAMLTPPARPELKAKAGEKRTNTWHQDEHDFFLWHFKVKGNTNQKSLAEAMRIRTTTQVRTHLQKYKKKIERILNVSNNKAKEGAQAYSPFLEHIGMFANSFLRPSAAFGLADPRGAASGAHAPREQAKHLSERTGRILAYIFVGPIPHGHNDDVLCRRAFGSTEKGPPSGPPFCHISIERADALLWELLLGDESEPSDAPAPAAAARRWNFTEIFRVRCLWSELSRKTTDPPYYCVGLIAKELSKRPAGVCKCLMALLFADYAVPKEDHRLGRIAELFTGAFGFGPARGACGSERPRSAVY